MTEAEYRAFHALSWSRLKALRISPLAYRDALDAPREVTDAMALGTATDCAMLTPERLPLTVAVWQEGDRRGKAWDAFKAANHGLTILKAADYERAVRIGKIVREHPVAGELLRRGQAQVPVTWTEQGRAAKGLMDWQSAPCVVADLKVTVAVDEFAFRSHAWRMGWFGQLAWYRRGVAKREGVTRDAVTCYLVAVESKRPHDVIVADLLPAALEKADEEIDKMLATLAECEASGKWPGRYETGPVPLGAPSWATPWEEGPDFELMNNEEA